MITLFQFPSIFGLPNASPFCLKLETYLRMQEIPYDIKLVRDPRKAPKGKLPFIKEDNQIIADSELIIDFLEKKVGNSLDRHLTHEQKAIAVLLDNTFTERLYWIMLYTRWKNDQNWPYIKKAYFPNLPAISKLFLPNLVRKSMLKALNIQGIGRHTEAEVLSLGAKTIDAIAEILDDKKYFFGELSSIDSTAFGFLANIAWTPFDDSLKNHLHQHKNILQYCERMWNNFYPEMAKPFVFES